MRRHLVKTSSCMSEIENNCYLGKLYTDPHLYVANMWDTVFYAVD